VEFVAAYTKPFEGPAWRDGRVRKKVRFYDEREWRYVPPVLSTNGLFIENYRHIGKEIEKDYKNYYSLNFTPDDIQYLIVEHDERERNVIELHDFIMRRFSRRFSRTDAILVTTAIMTDDCIRDDF
jgi:Putative abortive phage resistance protein AbiGi, antitoxin